MAARTGLNRRGPTVLVQCVDTSPLSRFKSQLLQSQAARPCMCYFCKMQYDDEKPQL